MTKEQIEAVLERVKTWPKERQEKAAEILLVIESMGKSLGDGVYKLSEEERADLEQGLAEAERGEFATDEEVAALFNKYRHK